MTNGQAAETPPGTPSRRALGAMESAVRRAREAQGGLPPPPLGPTPAPDPPRQPPAVDPTDHAPAPAPARRRPDRWLVAAVVAASVLVVVAAAALAVSLSRNSSPGAHSPSRAAAPRAHSAPRSGAAGTTTTSSATTPVGPAGVPVIGSLTPSSGSAGERIQVAGANFLSSNGQIVATFDGQVAPTSCPASNSCSVTVPPQSGSSSAQVSITTSGGTSNAVTFTYG